MEKNSDGSKSILHLHAVIIFNENYGLSFNILASHISYFYPRPTYRFNLEEVRNIDKSLVYVSKADKSLLTNVSISKMSPWFQLVDYCRTHASIKYVDPIIFNSKYSVNYIQQFHTEIQGELIAWEGFTPSTIELFCTKCPWVQELIDAYNTNIACSDKKPKHIYLHGDANCGKTSIIEKIIGENLERRTLIVNNYSTPFFLQNYTQGTHHYLLFDEFQYEHCLEGNINILKKVLERNSKFAICKKFQKEDYVSVNGPVFFISNYPLPEHADAAFKTRIKIIHATCPYYACDMHPLPPEMEETKNEFQQEKRNNDEKARKLYHDTYTFIQYTEHSPNLSVDDNELIKKHFPLAAEQNNSSAYGRRLIIPANLNLQQVGVEEDEEEF